MIRPIPRRWPCAGLWWMLVAVGILPGGADAAVQIHHTLHLRLEPQIRSLAVEDRITLWGSGSIEFTLDPRFTLERLLLDGTPLAASPQPHGGHRHRWQVSLGSGTRELVVRYHGSLDPIPAADHRGVLRGLPPMADIRGSFLPSGTGWYPEAPEIPITYRVWLDLPSNQRGLVPGRLTEEREEAGRYQAEFTFDRPTEGIDAIAGPYEVREHLLPRRSGPPMRLRTYLHPEVSDVATGYLDAVGTYLELYSRWIGEYPYTEFSVISSPLPTGFGMPTLTYLGIDVLRLPFIRTTSLGHEVLHNWWGNGVSVDWNQGNWSEALTTFMADYTFKEREGPEAAREMRLAWLRDFAAIPAGQDMAVRDFTARHHDASQIVGYHKGGLLFLMLRDRIGGQAFDAGIRAFWAAHRFRRPGWRELQRSFEQASGEDLSAFFAQWLDRRGAPRVRIEAARIESTPTGPRIRLVLEQSAPAHQLRVPIVVRTQAGSVQHVLDLQGERQEYALSVDSQPVALALDPDLRLFRRLEPEEVPPILRQVILDPRTKTVIVGQDPEFRQAGESLARRFLDHPPTVVEAAALPEETPVLLIGRHGDIEAFLRARALAGHPPAVAGKGTAQVWAAHRSNGKVLVVVSGRDMEAILALLRPLPHYGRQSYLAFDGATVIERGIWPGRPAERQFSAD